MADDSHPPSPSGKSVGLSQALDDDFKNSGKDNEGVDKQDKNELLSRGEALMNFLKASIGTGILALPCAFKYSGTWTGFVLLLILASICLYTLHALVRSALKLSSHKLSIGLNIEDLSYARVVSESFRLGPPFCEKISSYSGYLVNATLIFSQTTCVAVYQVFIAENIKKVVESTTNFEMSVRLYELILLVLLLPYSLIKSLKVLAVFNAMATLLCLLGLSFVYYECVTDLPPLSTRAAFSSWSTLPYFLGMALFAFEGIGTLMPILVKMKQPKEMSSGLGVINISMCTVLILSLILGFFGFWKYGEYTEESITLNLPLNALFNAVRIMFVASIFLAIDIQLYVAVSIIWDLVSGKTKEGSFFNVYGEALLKIILVVLTFLMATLIPHLDLLTSLIGYFASAMLIFVFPVLTDIFISRHERRHKAYGPLRDSSSSGQVTPNGHASNESESLLSGETRCSFENAAFFYARMIFDACLILLGLVLAVMGTVITVGQIIVVFRRDLTNGV